MNVFVLCTGRCGSTTFIKACGHATNYTAGHETRVSLLGDARVAYPQCHIEADNRLSWFLGRLDQRFGNRAFYVHLTRDRLATARSFTKRYERGIMKAYRGEGIVPALPEKVEALEVALDYCDTVNANIELFLRDKADESGN